MSNNTTPEMYDDNYIEGAESQTKEEILMSENDILAGLLALGNDRDEEASYRKIQIKRRDKLLLEFRIRPVTEAETQACHKRATKYAPSKPGQPKKAIETNSSMFRSYLIYTATVDEDRVKVWDNRRAQEQLGVLQAADMIEKVLFAGEKSRILDIIDEISGYDYDMEEMAKN